MNAQIKQFLRKSSQIFLIIFLVFIPLQSLVSEFLLTKTHLSGRVAFWLSHWYEPVIIVLAVVALFLQAKSKTNFSILQKIVLLLLLFGSISIFLMSPTVRQGIEGFRISLFFLLAIFVAPMFQSDRQRVLIKTYLAIAIIISLWAIIERFLPAYYWTSWLGLPNTFGIGSFLVGNTLRSASLIGGPNQLGSYLLPAAFLIMPFIFDLKKKTTDINIKILPWVSYITIVLAIGFAYSRAAVIGLIIGFVIYSLINFRSYYKIFLLAVITALCVFLPFYISVKNGNSLGTVVTHDTSQTGHNEAIVRSIIEIKDRQSEPLALLFGKGLGTAGPLVFKYGNGIISESWYLQIALELGLVGLLVWLALCISVVVSLFKKSPEMLSGFAAVSLTALFLHTFADNPAVSLTIFLLVGAILNDPIKLEQI